MATVSKRLFGPDLLTNVAATVYTVPTNRTAQITRIRVSNPSASNVTFTLSIGADGPASRIYDAVTIEAHGSLDARGPWTLATSEYLQSYASVNGVLVLEINGTETGDFSAPINGVVYGDSFAGGGAGETMAYYLSTLRTLDTWNSVSIGGLELDVPNGGAIGPGGFDFTTLVHNVYYIPGARNVVVFWSILIGETNDEPYTVNQIFDRYMVLVQLAQGLGWEVCATTMAGTTEYNDPGATPYRRPERIGVNNLLLNGDGGSRPPKAGAQYLANVAAIAGLGQEEQQLNPPPGGIMLQPDGIHPTPVGQSAVASVVSTALG